MERNEQKKGEERRRKEKKENGNETLQRPDLFFGDLQLRLKSVVIRSRSCTAATWERDENNLNDNHSNCSRRGFQEKKASRKNGEIGRAHV